jgi:hypothetical protein
MQHLECLGWLCLTAISQATACLMIVIVLSLCCFQGGALMLCEVPWLVVSDSNFTSNGMPDDCYCVNFVSLAGWRADAARGSLASRV